jgi:hypothetical protein
MRVTGTWHVATNIAKTKLERLELEMERLAAHDAESSAKRHVLTTSASAPVNLLDSSEMEENIRIDKDKNHTGFVPGAVTRWIRKRL